MNHEIVLNPELCLRCGSCARSCSTGYLRMKDGAPVLGGKIRCIGCGHCVAVCPVDAVMLDGRGPLPMPESPLEKAFLLRRSIRKFQTEAPSLDLIRHALDVAEYTPSGKNRHENRWSLIYGRERCWEIADMALEYCRQSGDSPELLLLAERGIDLLTCGAPTVLIGWSPDKALNPCVDTVLAMHTVQMLLEEQGLGCCWGGYLRQITGRYPPLKETLGIPEGCSMQCCMMLGFPAGEHYRNIPPRPAAEFTMV